MCAKLSRQRSCTDRLSGEYGSIVVDPNPTEKGFQEVAQLLRDLQKVVQAFAGNSLSKMGDVEVLSSLAVVTVRPASVVVPLENFAGHFKWAADGILEELQQRLSDRCKSCDEVLHDDMGFQQQTNGCVHLNRVLAVAPAADVRDLGENRETFTTLLQISQCAAAELEQRFKPAVAFFKTLVDGNGKQCALSAACGVAPSFPAAFLLLWPILRLFPAYSRLLATFGPLEPIKLESLQKDKAAAVCGSLWQFAAALAGCITSTL